MVPTQSSRAIVFVSGNVLDVWEACRGGQSSRYWSANVSISTEAIGAASGNRLRTAARLPNRRERRAKRAADRAVPPIK